MPDTKYCLCCNENVPYNLVERNETKEFTCIYCGFVLDVQRLWEREISKASEGYSLVAEDSQFVNKIIIDVLRSNQFSKNLKAFYNGLELIKAYSELLSKGAKIDIAIIDLNMPVMDGLTAARTIRSMEAQHKILPAPIVFFSAVKADDTLRKQMEMLSPASYMNKGTDPHPEKLAERVVQLVGYLMGKYKAK